MPALETALPVLSKAPEKKVADKDGADMLDNMTVNDGLKNMMEIINPRDFDVIFDNIVHRNNVNKKSTFKLNEATYTLNDDDKSSLDELLKKFAGVQKDRNDLRRRSPKCIQKMY